eukprot:TRINITY_DN85381_c0_g1_i1.p2 TRINITY_DN85381_c0_g1~~TRINITY_DN85381_c0_g1_i1.p2  ORF type:complete len:346 (+),score=67.59 TRINITY_DN85381_c0_g1_i1:75-1112(+)
MDDEDEEPHGNGTNAARARQIAAAQKELARLERWKRKEVTAPHLEHMKRVKEMKTRVSSAGSANGANGAPQATKATPVQHAPQPPAEPKPKKTKPQRRIRREEISETLYPPYLDSPPVWKVEDTAEEEGEEGAPKEKPKGLLDLKREIEGKPLKFASLKKQEEFVERVYELERKRAEVWNKKRKDRVINALPKPQHEKLKKAEEEALVARVYELDMKKKAVWKTKRAQRVAAELPAPPPPLKPDKVEELTHRLVAQALTKTRACHTNAVRKHTPKVETKKFTLDEENESVRRMYKHQMEIKAKSKEKLYKKHLGELAPPPAIRKRAEILDNAARMTKGKPSMTGF